MGQAHVDLLFKEKACVFPASEAVETNDENILIDHDLEMFEVGNHLKAVTHMVLNCKCLFCTDTLFQTVADDTNWKSKLSLCCMT